MCKIHTAWKRRAKLGKTVLAEEKLSSYSFGLEAYIFFQSTTVFFFHNKSVNSIFSHDLSAK